MNQKLSQLLVSFSKTTLKACVLFAQNPVFNSNKNISKLLEAYFLSASKIGNGAQEKEALYDKIFPSKVYNENRFRQIQTETYQFVLKYLAHLQLASLPEEESMYTKAYLQSKIPSLYEKTLDLAKPNKETKIKNEADYFAQFKSLDLANRFFVEENRKKGRKLNIETSALQENLLAAFILNYLRYACQEINAQNIRSASSHLNMLKDVLKWLVFFPLHEHPALHVYAETYQLIKVPSHQQFEKLKVLLSSYAHIFHKADAYELYIYSQNYCIRAYNSGEQSYLGELFSLYKESLEKEIILDKGELSPWDYKNIVFVGLKLEAYEWTSQFLYQFKNHLPKHEQENAFSYNLARTYFAQKNYSEVICLLQQVEYSDIFYQLDAKATLIKTYYELDEVDALDSLMESYKILLLRTKKVSSSYKILYNNFISFIKKMVRTKVNDKQRIEKLLHDLSQKPCADKAWVKEKLLELQ